jgi:pilus assembly protein Flp/PilA
MLPREQVSQVNEEVFSMRPLVQKLARFLVAEDGPTTVEYALLLMLIISVLVAAIRPIGAPTRDNIQTVATKLDEASTPP